MAKKLTNEQKEEIRKLQELGLSPGEISRKTGIVYFNVYSNMPEVKKKRREKRKKHDPAFREFQDLIQKIESEENLEYLNLEIENNPYVAILKCLNNSGYGKKSYQIERQVGGGSKLRGKLKRLREAKLRKAKLIIYGERRYSLGKGGKELLNYLPRE